MSCKHCGSSTALQLSIGTGGEHVTVCADIDECRRNRTQTPDSHRQDHSDPAGQPDTEKITGAGRRVRRGDEVQWFGAYGVRQTGRVLFAIGEYARIRVHGAGRWTLVRIAVDSLMTADEEAGP
jgi:hypothetical protein